MSAEATELEEMLARAISEGEALSGNLGENKDQYETRLERWTGRVAAELRGFVGFPESYEFSKIDRSRHTQPWTESIERTLQARLEHLRTFHSDVVSRPDFWGKKVLSEKRPQRAATVPPTGTPDQNLRLLFRRFHAVAHQIRSRYNKRPTLDVDDEYDVQDLLHSLLQIFFVDIRPEEYTPSYAGKASRMDFLLKPDKIVVEVKKTRKDLSDKEVGDELLIDAARYAKHPDVKHSYCFVYDPEARIANPRGLESDLSTQREDFAVTVIIQPQV